MAYISISFPHWALVFIGGKTYHLNRDGQIPQLGLCCRFSSLGTLAGFLEEEMLIKVVK